MPNLHSSSLFHFTSRDGLIGILSSDFYPRYCKERTEFEGGYWDYWIPMVSFCDIPLSLVGSHISEYGSYGLGMRREWALQNGLNPVFYYQAESSYFKVFNEMMTQIHQDIEEFQQLRLQIESIDKARANSRYLFQYYKSFKGHDFKIDDSKWFYDEREWRYVPNTIGEQDLIRDDRRDFSMDARQQENRNMERYPLRFTPKDISYVIIEKEEERFEFLESLSRIKQKFSYEAVQVLKSKIISVEQIREDL